MTPPTIPTGRATAIKTNGIGKVTTSHLNLTVDLTVMVAFRPSAPPHNPEIYRNRFSTTHATRIRRKGAK